MANSSGTASYNCTRDDMILSAFRLLRVLREGDVPNSNQTSYAVTALQMLLKSLQAEGRVLWTMEQLSFPMVANQASYTIGPSGADVTAVRPLRLFDGSYVRKTVGGVVTDTALEIFSRQRYEQVTTKAVPGFAQGVYYFPGIDVAASTTNPGTGYGTVYVYLASIDSTYSLYLNVQRPIYDMSSATDSFDLPQEWFRALKFLLAADMAPEYSDDWNRVAWLEKRAELLRNNLTQWNHDQSLVAFGEERTREEKARDNNVSVG